MQPGGLLTYTLVVSNVGALSSLGAYTVSDTLPDHTSFVSASPTPVLTSPVVQWVTDTVVISRVGAITFEYVVRVRQPLTDGLSIINQTYTVTGGNTITEAQGSPVAVTVSAPATLTAAKTGSAAPVRPGEFLTYTITVTTAAAPPARP